MRAIAEADEELAAGILAHCRERLAPYKRIRRLEFAELPKTISGKIRRVELRSREVAHVEMVDQVTAVPNATAFLDGVVFSRGQVVPAINMRARFGFERAPLLDHVKIGFSGCDLIQERMPVTVRANLRAHRFDLGGFALHQRERAANGLRLHEIPQIRGFDLKIQGLRLRGLAEGLGEREEQRERDQHRHALDGALAPAEPRFQFAEAVVHEVCRCAGHAGIIGRGGRTANVMSDSALSP